MRNLITRSITGAVFVALTVASVLLGGYFFLAFFVVIVFLGSYEFNALFFGKTGKGFSVFCAIISTLIFFILSWGKLFPLLEQETVYLLIVPLLFLIPIVGLFAGGISYVKRIGTGMLGAVILPLAFAAMAYVLAFPAGRTALLAFFCIIWTYDTFAYLVGVSIGKHRVCEAISPKKSWEGTIGGLIFGIVCALVFYFVTQTFSWPVWIGYALIICFFGTLGDYCESMLKRSVDVKDSGKILPGHGGVLDRFDSAILTAPFALLYLHLIF